MGDSNQQNQSVIQSPQPPMQASPVSSNPVQNKPKQKKKFIIIGIVIIALLLLARSSFAAYQFVKPPRLNRKQRQITSIIPKRSPTPGPTADWKTYTNTQYGFSFKYPAGWTATSSAVLNNSLLAYIGVNPSVPPHETDYGYPDYIAATVLNNQQNLSTEKMLELTHPGNDYTQFNLQINSTSVDGYSAQKVEIPGPYGQEEVFIKKANMVYNIELTQFLLDKNDPGLISDDTFKQVLNTFRLINQMKTRSSTSLQKISCQTNADCPSGDTCAVWGPIRADGPQNKYCTAPGQPVLL